MKTKGGVDPSPLHHLAGGELIRLTQACCSLLEPDTFLMRCPAMVREGSLLCSKVGGGAPLTDILVTSLGILNTRGGRSWV